MIDPSSAVLARTRDVVRTVVRAQHEHARRPGGDPLFDGVGRLAVEGAARRLELACESGLSGLRGELAATEFLNGLAKACRFWAGAGLGEDDATGFGDNAFLAMAEDLERRAASVHGVLRGDDGMSRLDLAAAALAAILLWGLFAASLAGLFAPGSGPLGMRLLVPPVVAVFAVFATQEARSRARVRRALAREAGEGRSVPDLEAECAGTPPAEI